MFFLYICSICWLGLGCGWVAVNRKIYLQQFSNSQPNWTENSVSVCIPFLKRLKRKFDIEKLQNCVISGEILTYCAPQIQYTPAQAPWSPIFTQNRKWAIKRKKTKKNTKKERRTQKLKTTNCQQNASKFFLEAWLPCFHSRFGVVERDVSHTSLEV